jgi:diaminohydroxyphosphoribosylaminopyrimidine deaminase/5-amino-6-(5-phosphoribosylamino)uracil reductase
MVKKMTDEDYMKMAFAIAKRGVGDVEPNPAVGCIIVKNNKVIGKGWHKKFGGPHAEINALADCKKRDIDPKRATMYVTLEPCCHEGKTDPCTEAIIKAGLNKVVVAVKDPSDKVNGEGIQQLLRAGMGVKLGILQKQAEILNAPFFKFATTGEPFVTLKWAQSIDGKLAWIDAEKDGQWMSNSDSRKDAHARRRSMQAIIVGVDTVIADNPQLTPRPAKGRYPLRVVLDSNLRVPMKSEVLKWSDSPTMLVTTEKAVLDKADKAKNIESKGIDVVVVKEAADGKCDLGEVMEKLAKKGIEQLMVEGGPTVIAAFLGAGLADAIEVYIAPKILGGNGTAGISEAMAEVMSSVNLKDVSMRQLDGDICLTGLIKKKS